MVSLPLLRLPIIVSSAYDESIADLMHNSFRIQREGLFTEKARKL